MTDPNSKAVDPSSKTVDLSSKTEVSQDQQIHPISTATLKQVAKPIKFSTHNNRAPINNQINKPTLSKTTISTAITISKGHQMVNNHFYLLINNRNPLWLKLEVVQHNYS